MPEGGLSDGQLLRRLGAIYGEVFVAGRGRADDERSPRKCGFLEAQGKPVGRDVRVSQCSGSMFGCRISTFPGIRPADRSIFLSLRSLPEGQGWWRRTRGVSRDGRRVATAL